MGLLLSLLLAVQTYRPMETVTYCEVAGKTLTLNAFIPENKTTSTPAMVEIHGGWFEGGEPMKSVPDLASKRGLAFFSINYRLSGDGGFPQCIRDCRNAIRFIRKNAKRFNVDASRIAVAGGSAGGHLSLMVAMVPENFDDGGPTQGLEGVSPAVCGSFSWIPPTDFIRFWNQGPDDVVFANDGTKNYRHWNDAIPNDARPHLRWLFHGIAPDTTEHRALYTRMCPIGQVRAGLPPLLICDGAHDPIVPGKMGHDLSDLLKKKGVEAIYWLSDNGHEYPGGAGFDAVLDKFLDRIYR